MKIHPLVLVFSLCAGRLLGDSTATSVAATTTNPTTVGVTAPSVSQALAQFAAELPFPGTPDTAQAAVAAASTALVGVIPILPMPPVVSSGGIAPVITAQPVSHSVASGTPVTLTVAATGTPSPLFQWSKNGRFIRGANAASYTITSAAPADAGSYTVEVYNGAGFATSNPALLSVANAGVVTSAPQSQAIATGATATFSVSASGTGLTYQWLFNGIAIPGATASSYTLANAGPGASGTFMVVVSNASAVVAEEAASLAVTTNARIVNLSIRGSVGTNNEDLVVGFVSSGTGSKQVLVRGVGPTLASMGVSGALAAPQLTLFDQKGATLATNSAWGGATALSQVFAQVYAFPLPANSADAAILKSLAAGSYTAHVTALNGTTGIALAELYDADTGTPTASLVNVSGRAYVPNGNGVLVAGFVISGPSSETVLIRGIGPSLRPYGIMNALPATKVQLFDSKGTEVTANAGWGNDPWISGTGDQVKAFPMLAGSLDSALLVTIPPGSYTAQVSGINSATGVGMVEIYEVR